jgi:hypothetical protein
MNDFNLTKEHIKIEDFKENISIENLNNLIKNNKLFLNLHDLEFNQLNKEIFNKYIELFINDQNIDNTYFIQLENYINYFDENSLKTTNDIHDIDISFYSKNKIKEYIFMVNFLSDFYKSKYKQKKEYNKDAIDTNTINFKLKKTFTQQDDIISIFNLNNIEYVPIELVFRNGNTDNSLLNEAKIKSIKINNLESTLFNVNDKREYTRNFYKLFNKLKQSDIKELEKNIDYYYAVLQSYKYNYYNVLLNYNTIQLYYVYIKMNGQNQNTNLVKYQEIYNLLENFNKVLLNNELKFNQLNVIMNTIDKLDAKAESEKIEDAKYSMNKLKDINNNLLRNQDYIRNNYKKIEVTQKDINTNTYKIIVISVLLALTFITYVITINYYSLDTSKILSLIVISVIIVVILVNNYIIKNKTYENFELIEETTESEDETTDELIKILESDSGSLSDAYEKINELQQNKLKLSQEAQNYNELEQGDDLSLDITSLNISLMEESNRISQDRNRRNYERIQETYNQLIAGGLTESEALSENIAELNNELKRLNREYNNLKAKEQELIGKKNKMEESLGIATRKVETAETQILEKMKTIDDMSTLLDEYQNMNNELQTIMLQKDKIKDLKLKKIDEINKFNIELLKKVEENLSDENKNETEIQSLDLVLSYLISDIDQLNKQKKDFEDKTTIEEDLILQLDLEIKTQLASYSKVADKVSQQMVKIANLQNMIENEDMAVQKLAKRIIELENKNKIRAQKSEEMAIKAAEEAKIAFEILKQKIEKIKLDIANKPKAIKYKLKLNLNFGIAGEENTAKRYNFKNEILLELSKLLLVPLNRFKIDNINEGSINVFLVFYPSRTYDNRDLSNDKLISKLEEIFTAEEVNNKLLNTKYLKFTMEISKLDESQNVVEGSTKLLNTSKYLNTDNIISKINNFLSNNSTIIKNIETIITQLENQKRNPNTYYHEINPKLNLEVKKYSEKNSRINNNTNILNSKTDILVHDYINSHYIYKYLSYITLLFAFVFLSYSYLNSYTLIIYILALIIFLLILFNLYLDIYKNVRRKSKKQYWTEPNKI